MESNDLRISFNYKHGTIRVFKKVISTLNNPKYVFFTWAEDTKTLSVIGTDEINNDCLLVSRHRDGKDSGGLKLHGREFIKRIGGFVGWELDKRYVVCGKSSEVSRSIEFDLTEAYYE